MTTGAEPIPSPEKIGQDAPWGPAQPNLSSGPLRAAGSPRPAASASQETTCQGGLDWLLLMLQEFVLVLDSQGLVQHLWTCNKKYCHPQHLLGRRFADVLEPPAFAQIQELFERALATGQKQELQCSIRVAGHERRFMVCVAAAADASHNSPTFCLTTRDITELVNQLERVEKSEALLTQAEEIANMGSFDYDPATGKVRLSKGLRRIHGASEEWNLESYWACLHPEDRERCQAAVRRGEAECEPYEYTARYLAPDGTFRTKFGRGIPIAGSDGKWKRTIGIVQDVTELVSRIENLEKSEALLSQAEEIARIGSWEYDRATKKVSLSRGLLRIFGVASEEKWSREKYWQRMHPADRDKCRTIVQRAVAEGKPFHFVARHFGPDFRIQIHLVRGLPIYGPDEKWKRTIGILQDITEQARTEEDLRRLSWELLRARDDDRRLVARELHETAGQSLAALKMILGRLRDAFGEEATAAIDLLDSAAQLADDVIREVRTISYLRHPPLLDEAGLSSAVRWYAEGFTKRSGIVVRVDMPDDFGRHSQELETTVFRILQEALTNVHRYSGSATATIRLAVEHANIIAEVRDEGSGLRPSQLTLNGETPYGVGIAGMRERVKHLGGVFQLESAPGRGTTVRAILPVRVRTHQTALIHNSGAPDA